MERLRQSDLQRLVAFVQDCYAIHEFEPFQEFVRRLVAALPRLIPAAHVTYNEMHPEKPESHNCVNTAELADPRAARLWENHMNEHPVLGHIVQTGDRRAMRISDFWSQRKLRDSGLHSDFYKHYGIGDALCITIPCRLPRVIGIGWHDECCFTDRERLIAGLVSPHINQAWQNARMVSRMQCQLQMLQQGMENLGGGVILCSSKGRVQFINAQALRYLAEYLNVKRQTDRSLPQQLLSWLQSQNQRLSRLDDAPPVRSPLILEKEGKRLTVRLLSQDGMHLILMEEARAFLDVRSLATLGLTAREVEVLTWIARGKTNSEIASILLTRTGTVKKHVEHILVKLGVETRTAAAARALACRPPDTESGQRQV